MIHYNINLKALKLRVVITTDQEEEELELAFSTTGIFRFWRSTIKPTKCIIGRGGCKLGVLDSEYERFPYEVVSVNVAIDRVIDAKIADDEHTERIDNELNL